MRNERRILLNTAVLSGAEGLGQLANFVLIASFARAFGAAALGHYSIGMAVGAFGALCVSLGTPALLIREISRDPACAPKILGLLLPVQLLLAPIAWLAACVVSILLIGDWSALRLVMAVCGYQILLRLAGLLLTPLQARELMLLSSSGDLAHRFLALLLALTAIWLGADAGTVALALVAGAATLLVYAWVQDARHFGRPALHFAPAQALQLFRRAAPFFGISALAVIYARGATLVLSALASTQVVGLYAVADRFMVAPGLAPAMFNSAVYPALARVAVSSLEEARALCARCLRLLLVGAIPLAALITIFSPDIVRLFFGRQYLGAAEALQVLAWTLPIRGAQSLLGSQLSVMDQQGALARARMISLCAFLVASPPLILGLHLVGAAWAVLLCDAVQLALYWRLLHRAHAAPALSTAFLAPAGAAAVMSAASLLLTPLSLGLRLTLVAAAMAAGMWGFGAVTLGDLRFLRVVIFGKQAAPPK
jgi:O-antigen/teichoic acid export membrane protein